MHTTTLTAHVEKKQLRQELMELWQKKCFNTLEIWSLYVNIRRWQKLNDYLDMMHQKSHYAQEEKEIALMGLFGNMNERSEFMMGLLWAQQIMLGKKTYAQVPRLLKDKVKEILIDSGCEDLVAE